MRLNAQGPGPSRKLSCDPSPPPSDIASAHKILSEFKRNAEVYEITEGLESALINNYFKRMGRRITRYYIQTQRIKVESPDKYKEEISYWLLVEPFNVAFKDYLYERPTLEIIGNSELQNSP